MSYYNFSVYFISIFFMTAQSYFEMNKKKYNYKLEFSKEKWHQNPNWRTSVLFFLG